MTQHVFTPMILRIAAYSLAVALTGLTAGPVRADVADDEGWWHPSVGTWFGTDGTDGSLRGRDANGNPVNLRASFKPNPAVKYVYDTRLDLTWLADGNGGAGSAFDDGYSSKDGRMTWAAANSWAASLTDSSLVTWTKPGDWALPSTDRACREAPSCTGSPMADLWFIALNNWSVLSGDPLNPGPFKNLQSDRYWTSTEYQPFLPYVFDMRSGGQGTDFSGYENFALAVRPGDVVPIPEASTWAMLMVGLGAVGAMTARRHR